MAIIKGTNGNDNLLGTAESDFLHGRAGADTLNGQGGVDYASYATATAGVIANLLDPSINTGDAAGDTYISIENLRGSNFNDTLKGDDNNNTLIGGEGADRLIGGGGADTASYATAAAAVVVSLVDPSVNTGEAAGDTYIGIEHLTGSAFNDTLTGDAKNNRLMGGAGADALDGGDGTDTASYLTAAAGVVASLLTPGTNTGDAAGDTYTSIENLQGSNFTDTLLATTGNNELEGFDGDDLLIGRAGADTLDGGLGSDTSSYSTAAAAVVASLAAPASNTGDAAGDVYISIENLRGSAFDDALTGDAGANILTGGAGADSLDGGAGVDTANYSTSSLAVVLVVNLADPSLNNGDAAGDTYTSIENLQGSNFADALTGNAASNTLTGGGGADSLDGGGGTDFASYATATAAVTASLADPSINTGHAAGDSYISIEALRGSRFNDTLIGDAGNNIITGFGGADTMTGGGGVDTFDFNALNEADGSVLTDFVDGTDTINLAQIDADTGTPADDAFTFIGTAAFSSTAGELRQFDSGGNAFVQGDIDGDGTADFQIQLNGAHTLAVGDFVL